MSPSASNFSNGADRSQSPDRPRRYYAALPAIYLSNPFQAIEITTEAMIRRGLPGFQITGVSPARESAERIRSAIQSCGEKLPGASLQVNLAPVDIRKTGAYLDLSIAVSILRAIGPPQPESLLSTLTSNGVGPVLYLGELSLDGRLLPVPRLLALLRESQRLGFLRVVLPASQIPEARLISGVHCTGIDTIAELTDPGLRPESQERFQNPRNCPLRIKGVAPPLSPLIDQLDLDPRARRALAIAAAGWHSMVLIGPPGMGKSSLAREVAPLLSPPGPEESLDIIVGTEQALVGNETLEVKRPVRAPHHSCTRTAMVGGGTPLAPGEITRAHHGVLLLDELAEFSRDTLQSLREPMELGYIDLSRGRENIRYPARFLLIATTNPCPCGQHRMGQCNCGPAEIRHYMNRILGPLRDRIDLEVRVERPDVLDERIPGAALRESVERAVQMQKERFRESKIAFNGEIPASELEARVSLRLRETQNEWAEFVKSRRHSHRSLAGIRRVARTIADLEGEKEIRKTDLQEALYYRCLDHYWS